MCTIIQIEGQPWIGKNHDSIVKEGMMFSNRRGIQKRALIMPPMQPLNWVSMYGSITFSQNGKEMPSGGMNERGLVVEQATLPETKYNQVVTKPAAGCLEVIQYLLDTCKTVEEALNALQEVSVEPHAWPIHFMLYDAKGNKAIVEYLEGALICYQKDDMDVNAVTNSPYKESCKALESEQVSELNPYKQDAMLRFKQVESYLKTQPILNVEETLECLKKVQRADTIWQSVYDVSTRRIHFKTQQDIKRHTVTLADIDFSSTGVSLQYDFSKGEHATWEPFSEQDDLKLLKCFYENEHIKKIMGIADASGIIQYIVQQAVSYEKQNK